MIKNDKVYKWDKREKDAFYHVKQDIAKAPMLYNPDFVNIYFSILLPPIPL